MTWTPADSINAISYWYNQYRGQYGMTPGFLQFVFGIAISESGLNPYAAGDQSIGGSYGIFQFYTNGGRGDGIPIEMLQDPYYESRVNLPILWKSYQKFGGDRMWNDPARRQQFFIMAYHDGQGGDLGIITQRSGEVLGQLNEFAQQHPDIFSGAYTPSAPPGDVTEHGPQYQGYSAPSPWGGLMQLPPPPVFGGVFAGMDYSGMLPPPPTFASPQPAQVSYIQPAYNGVPGGAMTQPSPISYTPAVTTTATSGPANYDSFFTIADKEHSIGTYAPTDLVQMDPSLSVRGGIYGRAPAISALEQMIQDAAAQGIQLKLRSGYRSYEDQSKLPWQTDPNGTAKPGYSEHQLGLAFDITGASTNYEITKELGNTPEGQWLAANAARYGFAMSYPDGMDAQTGYYYEPWHFRYLGSPEAASEYYSSGMTLNHWLATKQGTDSNQPSTTSGGGPVEYPLHGDYPITSYYGAKDIAAHASGHSGVDFGTGGPVNVYDPLEGRVIGISSAANPDNGYGLSVRIQTADGKVLLFGHLSSVNVNVGDYVATNQQIGVSGGNNGDWRDGVSTGPHLHFGVYQDGVTIDPIAWLKDTGATNNGDPNPPVKNPTYTRYSWGPGVFELPPPPTASFGFNTPVPGGAAMGSPSFFGGNVAPPPPAPTPVQQGFLGNFGAQMTPPPPPAGLPPPPTSGSQMGQTRPRAPVYDLHALLAEAAPTPPPARFGQ